MRYIKESDGSKVGIPDGSGQSNYVLGKDIGGSGGKEHLVKCTNDKLCGKCEPCKLLNDIFYKERSKTVSDEELLKDSIIKYKSGGLSKRTVEEDKAFADGFFVALRKCQPARKYEKFLTDMFRLKSISDKRGDQLEVQLAGCSVAAKGYATGNNDCKKGDYGWSQSFEDVKELRKKMEDCPICNPKDSHWDSFMEGAIFFIPLAFGYLLGVAHCKGWFLSLMTL